MGGGQPIGGPSTAGMGAKGGPGGATAVIEEAPAKKAIDPKLIGVGAFIVIGGIVAFLVNGGMSTGGGDEASNTSDPPPAPAAGVAPPPPVQGAAPPPIGPVGGGGSAPPPPQPMPFTTVVPPNPQYATGTMGVLVNKPGLTPAQAAGLASFAKNQYIRNGKWKNMQICVFANQQTADDFTAYQGKRKGQPLTPSDYQDLANRGVWSGTPAYLESTAGKDKIYYPSNNPTAWWSR